MIQAVFFDAVGTLFHVRGSVGVVYADAGLRHGITIAAPVVEANFRTAFRKAPPLAFPGLPPERLHEEEKGWWRERVRESFSLTPDDPRLQPLFDDLFAHFGGSGPWDLFAEVRGVLDALKTKGLMLGVISNFDSRLPRLLQALNIGACFDRITWSSRVGAEKPAPRIFLEALGAAGVPPETALHVGNELEADLHGSLAVGMKGVLLDREGWAPRGTGLEVIHNLQELPNLISCPF